MSYWEKMGRIASKAKEIGTESVRKLSKATGYTKSSIHRHLQARRRRNQYPESQLWETEAGRAWLSRLLIASLLDLGIKRGVGAESLSDFFKHLRIETHVGVSPSALRTVQKQVEDHLIEYGKEQQKFGIENGKSYEIVGGVDETFLEEMVLVMLDLPSGYLLLEEFASDRTTQTWHERVEKALEPFSSRERYLVSDRAKPLVNLAVHHIGCRSIADLCHVMYESTKGFSLPIQRRLAEAEKQLQKAQTVAVKKNPSGEGLAVAPQDQKQQCQAVTPCKDTPPPSQATGGRGELPDAHLVQLEAKVQLWQGVQEQYHTLLQHFSLTVHPFSITDGTSQNSDAVTKQLRHIVTQLESMAQTHDLPKAREKLKPVKNQLNDLASLMDVWWDWVEHPLAGQVSDLTLKLWLTEFLLPKVYWERQLSISRSSSQRQPYLHAFSLAQERLLQHPLTPLLHEQQLAQWHSWAHTLVSRFQRTSSPVEGRNGYLSQINLSRRGLAPQRLKVLTILHNFDLQRHDGSTAAQRFFGTPFPDLFEWLLPRFHEVPRPRKRSSNLVHYHNLPLDFIPVPP